MNQRQLYRTEDVICPVSAGSEGYTEAKDCLARLNARCFAGCMETVPAEQLCVEVARGRTSRPLPPLQPVRLAVTGLVRTGSELALGLCVTSAQDAVRLRSFRARVLAGMGCISGLHDPWQFRIHLAHLTGPLGAEQERSLRRIVLFSRRRAEERPVSFLLEEPLFLGSAQAAEMEPLPPVKLEAAAYLTVT